MDQNTSVKESLTAGISSLEFCGAWTILLCLDQTKIYRIFNRNVPTAEGGGGEERKESNIFQNIFMLYKFSFLWIPRRAET